METIRGRKSLELNLTQWKDRLANHKHIVLDLGTGDGRYARTLAERHPNYLVIGLDSCRENLREHSRAKVQNLLFVIAAAQELPCELENLISHITINFPWGSLLGSLLTGDPRLMYGLKSVSRTRASLSLHLNGGALAEAGKTLEAGTDRIYYNLLQAGWQIQHPAMLDASTLKKFPSTWAKRLAFGRDPRAMVLRGQN
ncbi:MAG TPA: class I SAM-dependent methyltransferase [Anaerolineales bacterium]|jgi:SAM-dependent methyltransferase|nr:class I SAM-dependent methyltransferase [Anaerolineales bacterium]